MTRALATCNLALLILYPIAWMAPLARAGLLPFFSHDEITIFTGIIDLWDADWFLALIVALFAVVAPYLKTIMLALIHFERLDGARWGGVLSVSGKLSMADVFLLALYIVLVKGVGIGSVASAWGLYLFTFCVIASLGIALMTERAARREVV